MSERSVLLVDDDEDIRFLASIALERTEGLSVRTAESAEMARALLAEGPPPDVLVLDVTMPFVDGPTFLQELRCDPRFQALPVIFMTGHTQRGEVDGLRAIGAAGVLRKPFDPIRLAEDLRKILDW